MPDSPTMDGMRRRRLALAALLALALALASSAQPAAAGRVGARASVDDVTSPAAAGWSWPVEGERRVLRAFLAPPTPYAAGHRGVDLAAPGPGAPVLAAVDGVVHFAGRVVDRGVVTIRSGPLLVTVEPVTASVAAGDRVASGSVVGVLEPGHCATSCVHLGVREAGSYVSPLRWLGGLRRAVLLPLEP